MRGHSVVALVRDGSIETYDSLTGAKLDSVDLPPHQIFHFSDGERIWTRASFGDAYFITRYRDSKLVCESLPIVGAYPYIERGDWGIYSGRVVRNHVTNETFTALGDFELQYSYLVPGGRFLVARQFFSAQVFDLRTGALVWEFAHSDYYTVGSVVFTSSGFFDCDALRFTPATWFLKHGLAKKEEELLRPHERIEKSHMLWGDAQIAVVKRPDLKKLLVIGSTTGAEICAFDYEHDVRELDVSPDRRGIAWIENGFLQIRRLETEFLGALLVVVGSPRWRRFFLDLDGDHALFSAVLNFW